jgi:hypothetical protein
MNMRTETETRRRRYAMHRLCLAMKRLMNADTPYERTMATRWVNAWGGAVGECRFSGMWYARADHTGAASAQSQRGAGRAH